MQIPTPYTFEEEVIDRLARIETSTTAAKTASEDQEKRLRSLEQRQWWMLGAASILAPIMPSVLKLLSHITPAE